MSIILDLFRIFNTRAMGFLLLFLLLFAGNLHNLAASTNDFKLTHFSATNRLPGESIINIYQDRLGLIWMAIETTGLIKFDGTTITHYRHDPENELSISSNHPTAILEDKRGYIWAGSSNGLNKLNRTTGNFTRFTTSTGVSNTIPNNYINDLAIDASGNIWVATRNGIGIINPAGNEIIRFLNNPDLQNPANNNEIHALHFDAAGNLWVGTALNGLMLITRDAYMPTLDKWRYGTVESLEVPGNDIERFMLPQSEVGAVAVRSLTSSHPDTIWIGSQKGLYYFLARSKRLEKFNFTEPAHSVLNNCAFMTLFIDARNNLWAGSSNDGLAKINLHDKSIHFVTERGYEYHNLASNDIRDIMQSRCGLVWIATKFGGLHYFDKRRLTFPYIRIPLTDVTSDEHVLAISRCPEGYFWIGTKGGGLKKLDMATGRFTSYLKNTTDGGIPYRRIEQVIHDNQNTMWVGTEHGLFSKKEGEKRFTRHATVHVRNICITRDNHIWIGTSHGLFRYSIKRGTLAPLPTRHVDFFDIERNIYITRVFEDSRGILWVATNSKGLFEYHHATDSLLHHPYLIENENVNIGNQVRDIHEDPNGIIWLGAKSDGLFKYDPGTREFTSLSNPVTLPSNTIYSIQEDDQGLLWFGTHNGISRYNPVSGEFDHFSTRHGLQGRVFETNAHYKTREGYILKGGYNGLNIFNPARISPDTIQGEIIITNFKVLNNQIAVDLVDNKKFTLDRKSRHVSITFALLDYVNPGANEYAYMLYPLDSDWVYSASRNFASYANLRPGSYTFKVKAANSDGIWMDDIIELAFTIPAPVWERSWFIPVMALVLVILLVSIYFLRVNAGLRDEAILKAEVQQRTKDLSEAYKKLEKFNKQIEKHNKTLRLQKERISRQNLELTVHRQNLELMVVDRTRDLEDAKRKAEESDRLKTAFLANMSHEIRTPLNAIMGFIDLLETDEFDKEERLKINAIIQSNSNSLLQLINDIIDISMIEANQLVIKKRTIDFNDFMHELYLHYLADNELKEKKLRCTMVLPDNQKPLFIQLDPYRVKQVFTNLINNAIKFTEKGEITFGYNVNKKSRVVTCYVKDTGPGISSENSVRLFERFRKMEPTQMKVYRGTGLGLSISKNLCELMGGNIWVESKVDEGSTFYFTIPLEKPAAN